MQKRKLTVLSGAGISAESGMATFRDEGGLWAQHDISEVATPEAFESNPEKVLNFYNERRRKLLEIKPNAAHYQLAKWEKTFDINIITQNVDDLHERAGSSRVIHLHGELLKARSTSNEQHIYDWNKDIHLGDTCPHGSQLRPHIVWFGEAVPKMAYAEQIVAKSDILIVIGTSLQVYPAAGLIHAFTRSQKIYYIDPQPNTSTIDSSVVIIKSKASEGLLNLEKTLLRDEK